MPRHTWAGVQWTESDLGPTEAPETKCNTYGAQHGCVRVTCGGILSLWLEETGPGVDWGGARNANRYGQKQGGNSARGLAVHEVHAVSAIWNPEVRRVDQATLKGFGARKVFACSEDCRSRGEEELPHGRGQGLRTFTAKTLTVRDNKLHARTPTARHKTRRGRRHTTEHLQALRCTPTTNLNVGCHCKSRGKKSRLSAAKRCPEKV
mmetsp:Transcript_98277/g.169330  ORF Transcript_98277/g.169330 Transcript_98277/m.169330 type:complete len:207 (+) Transcript_98277:965-1585(+)